MDRYPLYLDKKRRIKHYILTIVILVIAIIQTAHSVLGCGVTYVAYFGDFMIYYGQLGAILVPGLLGFMPGMIFTLILFIFSMTTAFEYAYFNSGFLITVLLTCYFAKKKVFNTKIGFAFSFLVLSFSQGPFW
ncbi:MAG: hypothetical protein K6B41_08445, partial [Butyrivibrio sp.]|nr:hypothetical protein [Butyrivibrio sp.]